MCLILNSVSHEEGEDRLYQWKEGRAKKQIFRQSKVLSNTFYKFN